MEATLRAFEQQLQDSLGHLGDPAYQHPPFLMRVLQHDAQHDNGAVSHALLQAIQDLDPGPQLPATTRAKRCHAVLFCRYVLELTQKETASRLNITPRHLRRIQQQAVHMLALALWQRYQHDIEPRSGVAPSAEVIHGGEDSQGWRTQMLQELAALQQNDPTNEASVNEEVVRVARLMQPIVDRRQIELLYQALPTGLKAAIHPALLRQVLIAIIEKLTQHMRAGAIDIQAYVEEQEIRMVVTGEVVYAEESLWGELLREIAAIYGGDVRFQQTGPRAIFELRLMVTGKIKVFVIDDNIDLLYLYRRYTASTQYQVYHFAAEGDIFQQIEGVAPDIIVLDIMLPNLDGWELLIDLHEHPLTRTIPVIVCSVVSRKELALALGAKLCLAKPIRRQEFIQALDQVQGQV